MTTRQSGFALIAGSYDPPAASSTPRCGKCGDYVVLKANAIGVLIERCPTCDRVAPTRAPHPDEVLVPQTLVRASELLPKVAPAQLRCQLCARGVEGDRRFCTRCQPGKYAPKPCRKPSCRAWFTPDGPNSQYCETCR